MLPEEREASPDGRVEGRRRRHPSTADPGASPHLDRRSEKVRSWREKWRPPLPGGGVQRMSPLHLRPDRGFGGAGEVEKGRRRSRGRGKEKLREGREGGQSEELPRSRREGGAGRSELQR
jgi:hypothetical protein